MDIICRETEKEILANCLNSNRPEFLAVYGRRRVGKTFLIREYCKNQIVFSISGTVKAPMKNQLQIFDEMLEEYSGEKIDSAKDWFEAFRLLNSTIFS